VNTRIPFNNIGTLPVPGDSAWMLPPKVKTFPLRHHQSKKSGAIYVMDEDDMRKRTMYCFRLDTDCEAAKRGVWKNWQAIGWEDCEVGHAWISATYDDFDDPDFEGVSSRVTWFVKFSHDGTPEKYTGDPNGEFWGWIVEDVSVMHAFERTPRDKTPITYEYDCKDSNGLSTTFQMTGNGQYDCEQKAKKKIDEDPNLRKAHLAGEGLWTEDRHFSGYCFVSKGVAA
tara:strand:+ start:1127 stop:1807 length:681 start_codon:yes stop_codon:yes gene_type:complete